MAFWNAEKIRFMEDAASQVPFNEAFAAAAAPFLPPDADLCDAGCGLGFLSLALAHYCASVTAADCDDAVLEILRKHQRARGIQNVHLLLCDIFSMPDDIKFDAMVFCFFGSIPETLHCIRRHCRGPAILFKKDWVNHRFLLSQQPIRKVSLCGAAAELSQFGVPFESRSFPVDMGQPFRSLDDAVAFFRLYDRSGRTDFDRGAIRQMLRPTDSQEFPYYLPAERNVGMIVLQADQIPALPEHD